MKTIPNDYQALRAIAKQEGIKATKKVDIQRELNDRGWVYDLWELVKSETRKAFERFKDVFRGGLWVHIYLDDQGHIRIRITHGANGPEVTRKPLDENQAAEIMAALSDGDRTRVYASGSIKKRSRVNREIIKAQKEQA